MDSIKEFMSIYLRCWEQRQGYELDRLFKDGIKSFQNLPQSKKALALTMVFDDTKGILVFLMREVDQPEISKDFQVAFNTAFHFLQFIITDFRDVCEPYVIKIKKCCAYISTLKTATYLHKVSCMTLILLIENFSHINLQLDDIIRDWMLKIRFFNEKELNPILRVISVVARYYPHTAVIIENANLIRNCAMKLFDKLFQDIQRNKPHVLQMTIESLVDFLYNFPLNEDDPELLKFYSKIKEVIKVLEKKKKETKDKIIEAIIKFITQQMMTLKKLILCDYDFWLRFLLLYHKDEAYGNIPAIALKVYYEVMGIALSESIESHKPDVNKLKRMFLRNLANESISQTDLRLSVSGYTNLTEALKKGYGDSSVEEMYSIIASRILPLYFSESEASNYFDDIADYLESLSRVLLHMSNVSNNQMKALVRLCILFIKRYPELSLVNQSSTVKLFKKSLSNIAKLKVHVVQEFMKNIIFEGIIWSCSHSLLIDAELQQELENLDKRPICYKNYVPLWKELLNSAGYEQISIPQQIVNEIIETCIKLIKTLNLSIKTREDSVFSDLALSKIAENEADFRIFLNMIDLYDEIFVDISPIHLKDKFSIFVYEIIKASYKYPLLSGFYRLMNRALNVEDYFDTEEQVDKELFKMILQYLQSILNSVYQFPYELQVSCIQLILHTPIIFILHLIDHLVPIFKISLTVGLNDYDVANSALSALENYLSLLENDKMNVFIKELMPLLELYLRSKESFQVYDDSTISKEKSTKNDDDDLEKLQKRILLLFGKFELSVVMKFLHNQSLNTGATWDKKNLLEYSINFPDMIIDVQLDIVLPRITELALNSSDRRTRVGASEVLHSIIAILLGKTVNQISPNLSEGPDRLAPLYKTLSPVLLRLGSDSDEVIRQLYNPLTLQITHWLSSRLMLYSPAVGYFVDALFDGLSDENNFSLRDFSGICLAEFIKWSIKQSSDHDLTKSPININTVVENITNFALHPSKHRRIAAAIAFNYLHVHFSQTEEIIDIFWFELLYAFVKSVNGCDDSNIQITINHLQNILIKKSSIFNAKNPRRKIPTEFNGGVLKDAVDWLFTQCSSSDCTLRKTAMNLFENLSSSVDNCDSPANAVNNYIDANGIEGLNRIILKDADDTIRRIVLDSEKSLNYLKNILKTFNCYTWLIEKKLIDTNLLFSDLNINKDIIFTCIENFTFAVLNPEMNGDLVDSKNVTLVYDFLCQVIIALFELLSTILHTEISEENWVHNQLFINENLFTLISRCIIEPQEAGFDVKNLLITETLPTYLEKLLNIMERKVSITTIHFMESRLNNDIQKVAENLFNIDDDFVDDYMKRLNIVKGLILLNKCGIFEKLNVGKKIVSNSTEKVLQIFDSLKIAGTADIFITLSTEKKMYLEYLLKLLLHYNTNSTKIIIERLLVNSASLDSEPSTNISHGEYFFNTFKDVIISSLLNDLTELFLELSNLLQHYPDVALFLSEEIVVWVLKHKNEYSEISKKLAEEFIKNFQMFHQSLNDQEGRKKSFTNIYSAVVRLKSSNVLHKDEPLYIWILNEFSSTDDLAKKARILNNFLICLTEEESISRELGVILGGLKKCRPENCCEILQGDTLMVSKIMECFQALINLLPVTKSINVLHATIIFSMGIGKSVFNDAAYGYLFQYINSIPETRALESLKITYDLFMEISVVKERLDIIHYFLIPMIENCKFLIIEQFFEENIQNIFTIISQELPRYTADCRKMIVSKICCFKLLELMFNKIDPEQINDREGLFAKNILEENSNISVTQKIFKCALQVRSWKTEVIDHEEILRLLHCAAYNCCITIASTTRDEKYYLSLFAENRKSGQLIWEHIVDCKKTYELSQTFREYPKQQKKLVNIKNTLRNRLNADLMFYSYMKSYNLTKSTLDENIPAEDFTAIKSSESSPESLAITLEVDDLNNHECMYSICGILKKMIDDKIGVSGDGRNPPKGLQCFAGSIGCVHYNAKLFMLKIILNNQAMFKPYAELFLAPIISVLISMLTEGKLNYIITDALLMLIDWAEIAVPDQRISEQANELFSLLVKKVDEDLPSDYVVKYNFRIVEMLVQVWYHCLRIAPGLSERIRNTKQNRLRAVQLILIYLANKMAAKLMNEPDILEFLIEFLKENWSEKDEYAIPACEAISLYLQFSNYSEDIIIEDENAEKIRHVFRELQKRNADRLVKCIHAMCKAYPALADYFFEFIIANSSKIGPPNLAKCLEVFLIRIPKMNVNDILRDLNYLKFVDLLNNKVISCEKVCLEIIGKLVPILDSTKLVAYATLASGYSTHDSPEYRKLTYDIFMSVFKKYSQDISESYQSQLLVDMSKRVLLPGILDPFESLQIQLLIFWTEEVGLKETCVERMIDILDVYSPDVEKDFLPIFAIIFLQLTKKSPKYSRKMFESLNSSCNYKNYQIAISWRMKNLSYRIPLFTSSYASQYTQRFTLSSFAGDEMISAYNNLMLRATFTDSDQSATNDTLILGKSSTLTENDVFIVPEAPSRNILSKRFLKNPTVSSTILNRKLEHYQAREDAFRQNLNKQRNLVKLNRMYRIGDFPDIEITHESFLTPLQELIKKDQLICKDLVVSMIYSLLNQVQNESKNGKRENGNNLTVILEKKLNYILENRRGSGLIIAAVLEIMFKMDDIKFNPTIVTHVSQLAGFNTLGALLLERNLYTDTVDYYPPAKRSRNDAGPSSSVETNQWIYLAELYESINEVDIVLSIFQNHVTEIEELCEAAIARADAKWNKAIKYYEKICNSEVDTIRRHSRQGMFECFARLCDWQRIIEIVQQDLSSQKSLEFILVNSESVEDGWMSAWYFQALVYRILTWQTCPENADDEEQERCRQEQMVLQEFQNDLEVYLKIPSKAQMLKNSFAEEIARICSFELQAESKDFINTALDKVREQWNQLNPLSAALRAKEVIKLRGISNVEIYRKVLDDPSKIQSILIKYWLTSIPQSKDDLLPWDRHIAYRWNCMKDFKNFIEARGFEEDEYDFDLVSPIVKLKLQMIEAAFQQENKSLMKNYLQFVFNHLIEDDNEFYNQFKLNKVRFRILRAKAGNAEIKLVQYPLSWKEAEEILRNDNIDINTRISTRHFISDLALTIIDLSTKEPELYREIFNNIEQYILPFMSNPDEEIEGLNACCLNNLKTSYMDALRHSKNTKLITDCCERLLKYCYDRILDNEDNRDLIREFIKSTLKAIGYGSRIATNYFPCLLNPRYLEDTETRKIFKKECQKIPSWRFLKWQAQLLTHLPTSLEDIVAPIVEKLIQKYPNALIYNLKLTLDTNLEFKNHPIVLKYIQNLAHKHELNNFIKAMEYLVRPELYLIYHLEKLLESPNLGDADLIDNLMKKVYPEETIPSMQGDLYKYITKYREDIFKMKSMTIGEIKEHVVKLKEELLKSLNKKKDSKYLKDYSPWLSEFCGSDIEIPGQYSGDQKPMPKYHVKIMKLESKVQVMKSGKKPIKVTLIGNDAKNYNFLVKFGEDLRLDERVEQAFGIMNEILQSDMSSSRRNLALNTYQVVALSGSFGLIQWIDNTKNLNDYIEFNLNGAQQELLDKLKLEYSKWIYDASPKEKQSVQYKEALIKYDKQAVTEKMNSLMNKTEWCLLRRAFLTLSPSLESFMSSRRNFIITYGTMCIGHWILGIGDRHLENTLISVDSGKTTGIDFASAFGGGIDQPVPELVPFRLTNQIKGLMKPFNENDEFKAIMIHVLRALRNGKGPLLAYLRVVANENLNWIEHAQKLSLKIQEKNRNISWLASNKFDYVTLKLNGKKPSEAMLKEMKDQHYDTKYFPRYIEIVSGIEGSTISLRAKKNDDDLSAEEQVSCLLDQATDLNVLGRMYMGWTPWI
ncbi:DNA-dependent protein kinase catalytic subunit-like [Chelonus insularis]|uniref:DNA-dependent protein kinase catalytic subunit-like n=1 Tax=Chelonus insularis TaxID=460826 RepID=UPI00158B70D8|nr:DNA-dependent protein kinase catalytic subunit-like [Chelonus insularis]